MPGETPFYAPEELRALGCVSVGRQTQVSRLARFYGFQGRFGDHIRIDDFVILKGRVDIGCFVHISSYCLLGGTAGTVTFGDFSTTAAYVGIYTASDDYSSPLLTNSVVPDDLKRGITGMFLSARAWLSGHIASCCPRRRSAITRRSAPRASSTGITRQVPFT